jgi:hypothetical protein
VYTNHNVLVEKIDSVAIALAAAEKAKLEVKIITFSLLICN